MAETENVKIEAPRKPARIKSVVFTVLKIAIAVVGIWLVAKKVTWQDSAILAAGDPGIRGFVLVEDAPVTVVGSSVTEGGKALVRIRMPSGRVKVRVETAAGFQTVDMILRDGELIPGTQERVNLDPEIAVEPELLKEENGQRIQEGMHTLLLRAQSKWYLLLAAWALLGIPFLVTAIRWRNLMRPQGIEMGLGKSVQLTFVGQFYSIMLPGITGGDLVKIVYAARLTGSKTKSFITVVLDRVIGLVALMVIAGTSAGVQLVLTAREGGALDNTLLNVFILIAVMLAALAAGSVVYFSRRLRRLVGIEWFVERFGSAAGEGGVEEGRVHLEKLFRLGNGLMLLLAVVGMGVLAGLRWGMQISWAMKNTPMVLIGLGGLALVALVALGGLALHGLLVEKAGPLMVKGVEALVRVDETLHVYRGHFGLLAWAFVISLISQMTLPLSGWLSGIAFGMNAPMTHYLAYVPVANLATSLPISPPQGFGVLEGLLIQFFKTGKAFALAQAVRFLPLIWNLLGAYWVMTGRYSRNDELPMTNDESNQNEEITNV